MKEKYIKQALTIKGDLIEDNYNAKDFIVVEGNTLIKSAFILDDKTLPRNKREGVLCFKGNVSAKYFIINTHTRLSIIIEGDFTVDTILLLINIPLTVKGKLNCKNLIQYPEKPELLPKTGIKNYVGIIDKSDDEIFFKEAYRDIFGVDFEKLQQGILQHKDVFLPKTYTRLNGLAPLFVSEFFNQGINYMQYAGFKFVTLKKTQLKLLKNKYNFPDIDDLLTYENSFYQDDRTDLGIIILDRNFIDDAQLDYSNSTINLYKRLEWLRWLDTNNTAEDNFEYWLERKTSIDKTFENEFPFLTKDLYLALNWYIIFAFLNDKRQYKIKPILEKYEFDADDPHGFGIKVEAVCSFFAQIGTDGNMEVKDKDAYYFKDKRANAIQVFKSRTTILNNFEGENLAIY